MGEDFFSRTQNYSNLYIYKSVCTEFVRGSKKKKVVALELSLSLGPDKHFETHTEGGLCVNI